MWRYSTMSFEYYLAGSPAWLNATNIHQCQWFAEEQWCSARMWRILAGMEQDDLPRLGVVRVRP